MAAFWWKHRSCVWAYDDVSGDRILSVLFGPGSRECDWRQCRVLRGDELCRYLVLQKAGDSFWSHGIWLIPRRRHTPNHGYKPDSPNWIPVGHAVSCIHAPWHVGHCQPHRQVKAQASTKTTCDYGVRQAIQGYHLCARHDGKLVFLLRHVLAVYIYNSASAGEWHVDESLQLPDPDPQCSQVCNWRHAPFNIANFVSDTSPVYSAVFSPASSPTASAASTP